MDALWAQLSVSVGEYRKGVYVVSDGMTFKHKQVVLGYISKPWQQHNYLL